MKSGNDVYFRQRAEHHLAKAAAAERACMFLDEDMAGVLETRAKLIGQSLLVPKPGMDEHRIVRGVRFEKRIGIFEVHILPKKYPSRNCCVICKLLGQETGDANSVVLVVADVRVDDDDRLAAHFADSLQGPVKPLQGLLDRFDDRHKPRLCHHPRCLPNGDEFELFAAKIWIVHRRIMSTPSPF